MKRYLFAFLFNLSACSLFGQSSENLKTPEPKRFIDRIEVFAGPSLSLNYGNKFIENYEDKNVTNKRLVKPGYTFGIGVYHPLSNRFDLNVRVQFEQKGTNNELNTPALPDGRIVSSDNYSYRYLTLAATPQIIVGRKMNFLIAIGGYYSQIKGIKGSSKITDTNGTINSEGSFEGRYFYDLADDGIREGFAWMPNLTSIENYDFGLVLSVGYKVPLHGQYPILIQLQDNLGINNINKDNPYELKERGHSIALIFSYSIKLPPKK
ncbi:MAG TPA: hypothetical protein VFU05_13555 [Cyclobacteriaceae bacterium]|nr:hypothetical protein [Cyclobacteriaceae bacterium]